MIDKEYFYNLKYAQFKDVFNKYVNDLSQTKLLRDKNIKWNEAEGTINVFVIRCNDLYITNDINRNNDWLVILENRPDDCFRLYVFECTADPKFRKDEIANLLEQIYFGNIRNHKWIFGRLAICQDNCEIYVRRFTGNHYSDDLGHFGINIHDNGGFFNSSLGCVILASQQDNVSEYQPLLKRVSKNNIPVAVIRDIKFQSYI